MTGMFDYDAELRRYQQRLRAATDVRPDDHVLDIGCGAGRTTREAARTATRGSALGVDISAAMVERARELADGLDNVRFEQADAQVHPFPADHFTLGVSRFGTMFFADPVAAFTNIRRGLRPGARLVQLVWQAADRQDWVVAINRALDSPPPVGGPFSLADPATVEEILTGAGFTDVQVTDVREPVYYGPDPDTAAEAVLVLRMVRDSPAAEHALDRLRPVMAAHATDDGVWFDSRAWLVTARR